MAIQIPEPDFYTLAEVAERWGISQDILLRLGVERKIIIGQGVIPPVNISNLEGILDDSPSMACFIFSDWVNVVDGDMQEIDTSKPVPKKIYMKIINSAELLYTIEYSEALKNKPEGLRIDPRVNNDDLVIPASEIHRIERQQEKADQVIAKAEAESPIPSQSKRALNTRAKVIGALVKSHNINLDDRGAASALSKKLELQGVALDLDTVRTILKEAKEQIEKPN